MTSQVRMKIVLRTGVGNTPKVTPDRFSPARTATRAAELMRRIEPEPVHDRKAIEESRPCAAMFRSSFWQLFPP